ncbi:hypothetical protein CLU79DRAFT_783452, partial [Phycomyces nitens]
MPKLPLYTLSHFGHCLVHLLLLGWHTWSSSEWLDHYIACCICWVSINGVIAITIVSM